MMERRIIRRVVQAVSDLEVLVIRVGVLVGLAIFVYRYLAAH